MQANFHKIAFSSPKETKLFVDIIIFANMSGVVKVTWWTKQDAKLLWSLSITRIFVLFMKTLQGSSEFSRNILLVYSEKKFPFFPSASHKNAFIAILMHELKENWKPQATFKSCYLFA